MTVGIGFTAEEIREFVHDYEVQPFGTKLAWLAGSGVSYERLRDWRSAVFEGDLERGLVPRKGMPMTMRFPRKSRHPLFASALGARWKDVEYVESKEVHDRVQGRGRASGDRFGSVDRGGRPGVERG